MSYTDFNAFQPLQFNIVPEALTCVRPPGRNYRKYAGKI